MREVSINYINFDVFGRLTSQRELETMRRDAASYQREIELLKGQFDSKDTVIASKEEIISLLRGGYNRPN